MILAGDTVTLDGAGYAARTFGPQVAFSSWLVQRVAVQTNTGKPEVRLYRGTTESIAAFVDGTRSGNGDVGEYNPPLRLTAGESLLVVWRNGTPGAACSVTLTGEAL